MASRTMRQARRGLACALTLVCALCVCAPGGAAQSKVCIARHYSISAIPLRPVGINQSGEVAGTSAAEKAALWSKQSGLREIELIPGYGVAQAVALNNSGQVIGFGIDRQTNRRQGFIYKDGKVTVLSEGARVLGINDAGDVAGEARTGDKGRSGPVMWESLTPLALGGCCGGTAVAINHRRQVVGEIYDEQGHYHAFEWDKKDGLRRIGRGGDFTTALLLNEAGDYVLQSFPGGQDLYRDGKPTHLNLAPKVPSHPRAMNQCDAMVGSYGIFADYYLAFAWDPEGGFRDLNSLIPADSGWKLQEGTGINDRGEIVGWGTFKGREDSGFQLTPVD